MKRRYHVLDDPSADEDPIDAVEDELERLRRADLPGYELAATEGDPSLAGYTYLAGPDDPVLTVVRDAVADTWYVMVEGEDDDHVDQVADALVEGLRTVDPADLRAAAEAPDAGPRDLVRLALGSTGPADEAVVRVLTTALASPDVDLRGAAVEAAGLTQWPRFVVVLEDFAATEHDPDLKRFAEATLAALRRALSQ
ncbi:MAG: hypothetical protein HOV94_18175 [Saccharothrix sp.]|nr:hypothetical protein [Saccharothrix sp.]